jgi:hypothetical protein
MEGTANAPEPDMTNTLTLGEVLRLPFFSVGEYRQMQVVTVGAGFTGTVALVQLHPHRRAESGVSRI